MQGSNPSPNPLRALGNIQPQSSYGNLAGAANSSVHDNVLLDTLRKLQDNPGFAGAAANPLVGKLRELLTREGPGSEQNPLDTATSPMSAMQDLVFTAGTSDLESALMKAFDPKQSGARLNISGVGAARQGRNNPDNKRGDERGHESPQPGPGPSPQQPQSTSIDPDSSSNRSNKPANDNVILKQLLSQQEESEPSSPSMSPALPTPGSAGTAKGGGGGDMGSGGVGRSPEKLDMEKNNEAEAKKTSNKLLKVGTWLIRTYGGTVP